MRIHHVLLITGVVCLAAGLAGAAEPVQWRVEDGGNGHFYEYVADVGIPWITANAIAGVRSFGGVAGHLATVTSQGENDFLAASYGFDLYDSGWLGGRRDASLPAAEVWQWVTGESWSYVNWAPGYPRAAGSGTDYVSMWGYGAPAERRWRWYDDNNNSAPQYTHGYFVEYAVAADSGFRQYMLGDVDGVNYNGAGSADDVYIDPDVLANLVGVGHPVVDFDVMTINQNVPFTFEFPLVGNERVVTASLTVGLKAVIAHVSTDAIFFYSADGTTVYGPYYYSDLGWLPISQTGTTVRSVDLADVLGDDLISLLQAGQLSCQVRDDAGVDYARLTIEVVPEPATAGLMVLGGLALVRKRRGQWRR